MLTIGGYRAVAGTYWNLANGYRVQMDQEGDLPGDENTLYLKAPVAVMLTAAPIIGLLFALFLPFIAMAMTVQLIIARVMRGTGSEAAKSLTFGWRPIEAYLASKKAKKAAKENPDKK